MWRRALGLALVLTFVAGPGFARGKRGKHRDHHRPYVTHHVQHHHHYGRRARVDAGDALLFLGLTAIGLTAINAWSQNAYARERYVEPRYVEPYPRYVEPYRPSRVYADDRVWDDRRVVFTERNVTPIGDVYRDGGEYCREYQTDVEIGGRLERAYGTACLQPDGTWATR